ncbi:hypothetical protein Tco_1547054 [Tanacetum coccineum]
MADHSWIESMQDELNQFERLQVWELVPRPEGKNVIALKWLWKNKLQVYQSHGGIFISQSQYAIELLKKHGLDECVSMSTPMATERLDADLQGTHTDQTTYHHMIGGLMYLTTSRPDIAFATFVCARYQARPTVKHLKEVKRIFRYLRQSYHMSLWYLNDCRFELIAYLDADHAGCKDDCKSTSGGLQFLGGKLVSWSSKKQDCTAMSTAEAEYVSLSACCAQISDIILLRNVENSVVEIYFVGTEYQLADLFTKALPKERFEYLVHRIVIIMAQQQHAADVHPDELCPSNKRYDLMDANKKVDLEHFWHTLKEDGSKYRLMFMLDKKELYLTLDDFRTIFHLPQANENNHNSFMPPPSFTEMVPFYKQQLGFTIELKTLSTFKTSGLLQPWQTLCKIFSMCLTTRVTGWDQLPLLIMHMMYCFVNNIHVDYAKLLWEGISILFIIQHLRFRRHKDKVGMPIPDWMITEEMKHTEHYKMSPTPKKDATESSALKRSTVIRFCLLERRSTRLTPPTPMPTVDKADEMILQDTLQIPSTRLEPRSDKKRPEVESTNDEEVEVTNVVIPVNVNEEEDEITDEVYELKRREKGKIVEETRSIPFPTPIRSPRTHTNFVSSDTEKLQELTIPSQVDASVQSYMSSHILHVHPVQSQTQSVLEQQYQLYFSMKNNPQPSAVRPRDQDNPYDDAHLEGENSAKRQKTSEYKAYVSRESSSRQVNEEERDDDEIPSEQVSQDIMEEVSLTIDEAKLKKMADEMLRQRLERKFLSLHIHERPHLSFKAVKSLINQDLLYLKKGSSGPEKIVLSLHKFSTIIFNDVDIDEQTSRWVNKCVKKFNPYARYGVEHWKNLHAKIFYIRKQKVPGKQKEEVYSNSKIIQVIKTYWELGHEHKFITEIVARRANECIVSITKPDYKNLNKNDIEDMYVLIMNGKVPDYAEIRLLWSLSVFIRSSVIWERVHDFQLGIESYQQKVNLTAPTISFPGVEKHRMFSIIYEPVHGIIYKNSKKEKRVMRHSEIQKELTNDEVEYLKLFEEEIEVRLKYRNQMRRWEMYVNGRPLGPRRERPE